MKGLIYTLLVATILFVCFSKSGLLELNEKRKTHLIQRELKKIFQQMAKEYSKYIPNDDTQFTNKLIPRLPEEFYANPTTIETRGMMQTSVKGKYYRSYSNLVDKVIMKMFGQEITTYSYYKCQKKFTPEFCKIEDMNQEMYPIQIPPFAEKLGKQIIDGIEVDHYFAKMPFQPDFAPKLTIDFYITKNTDSKSIDQFKYVPFRTIIHIEMEGVPKTDLQMDFRNLEVRTFDVKKDFIVPTSVCKNAPQDIEKCDSDIFPKVTEKNVIFLLDTSGSMSTKQKTKEGMKTRLDIVKQSMRKIISKLKPQQKFNILSFSSGVRLFKDQPIDATQDNIDSGIEYVKNLREGGYTYMFDALKRSLSQTNVEAIYFLTDGEPTQKSPEAIIKMVNDFETTILKNVVKIHSTNFYGSEKGKQLLKKIANISGGIFTNIADGQL